ncbi:cobalt transporter [Hahella sp. CCB-MM4]|uniref:CbtB domain-containing protein n=1 Tax=Hahella sp. (strain CCB-MM4) TaxID=1926491 RepID=UPI000B9B9E32|nr:CbtB domain-containing protein [Hahella sp. CCB-MM4]OZG72695.1 cobalt transporter [Hahella sp. CCB-MM4]
MSIQSVSSQQSVSRSASFTLLQTISAFVFGAVIVYAVGFLPMGAAHNAAHDTRHSLAFPCH